MHQKLTSNQAKDLLEKSATLGMTCFGHRLVTVHFIYLFAY